MKNQSKQEDAHEKTKQKKIEIIHRIGFLPISSETLFFLKTLNQKIYQRERKTTSSKPFQKLSIPFTFHALTSRNAEDEVFSIVTRAPFVATATNTPLVR